MSDLTCPGCGKEFETVYERADAPELLSCTCECGVHATIERRNSAKGCEYCTSVPKSIGCIEYGENALTIDITGHVLRIFDDEYPGITAGFEIKFCPACGRALSES